jgi:hypothetical protein
MLCVVSMVTSIVVGVDLGAHYNRGAIRVKQNNGCYTKSRLVKSFRNRLRPFRRMMNFTNNG